MKLSTTQWLWISFFVASVLPAYLISNWQYEKKLSAINAILEREQSIHASTDKLIKNCEELNQANPSTYGPNQTICKQGRELHERTDLAKEKLNMEKAQLQVSAWISFFTLLAGINLVGYILYKGRQRLSSEHL